MQHHSLTTNVRAQYETHFDTMLILLFIILFIVAVYFSCKVFHINAQAIGLLDKPNQRSSHENSTPTVGGMGIFIPYLIIGLSINHLDIIQLPFAYWISLASVLILGLIDDLRDLDFKLKFIIQLGISIGYVLTTEDYILNLYGLFEVYEIPFLVGIILSVMTIVFLMNAVNLIDGIDGLASGSTLVSVALFSFLLPSSKYLINSILISAGLIIFLAFNFSRDRKIFLGDSGSLSLGFILASQTLGYLHHPYMSSFDVQMNPILILIFILGYPIADTLRVFTIRIFNGLNPFSADRRHMHHVLLNYGFSHPGASTFIMTITLTFILSNLALSRSFEDNQLIIINILLLTALHLIFRTQGRNIGRLWKYIHYNSFYVFKRIWLKYFDE